MVFELLEALSSTRILDFSRQVGTYVFTDYFRVRVSSTNGIIFEIWHGGLQAMCIMNSTHICRDSSRSPNSAVPGHPIEYNLPNRDDI
jgi:hypothetical protein